MSEILIINKYNIFNTEKRKLAKSPTSGSYKQQEEKETLGLAWIFETTNPIRSDTFPIILQYLLQKAYTT